MKCDICYDRQRIRLPIYRELEVGPHPGGRIPDEGATFKEFDCPQCVPTVPYRRVRAMKVATAYPADEFGKYQMPIERGLAARFGEYLLREGLIRFTTSGSADMGAVTDKITVTAHLGVVSRENVERAGAIPEVALTAAPEVSAKLTRQQRERLKLSPRAKRWEPKAAPWAGPDAATDEFDEPKDAIANRFSGLEI